MVEGSLFRWEPLYKVTPLLWWQSVSSHWSMVGQRASPLASVWNNSEGPAIRVLELPKGFRCTTAQRLPLPSPLRARPIKLLHQIFTLEFVSWETRSKKIHQPQPCLVLWECHQEFSFRDIIQVPACPLPLVNHILSESLPLSTPATADWPTSNLKRWSGPVGMASLWITV